MNQSRRLRRKLGSWIGFGGSWLATALVLFSLVDMVATILWHGVLSFRPAMLWTVTSGNGGGLENAILGTLYLVFLAVVISAPLGILGGIFVSEFAGSRLASVIRFCTEGLSGVPSIVIGYFGYLFMVIRWGWEFSTLAGSLALTVIMVPYILRSTEASLQQVPHALREAAWGLGMTKSQAITRVIWKSGASGIITGVLLAVAIGLGETAPLLYTAGWSMYNPSLALTHHQIGYLTYVVWTYIDMPYNESHALAYSAACVLLVVILFIHLVLRTLVQRRWSRTH
ncbi:phosphate transport system permease protein PstA 2 [Alicyclobacillus contaminans]|uniref:phosphate ABC transporter permease PstA n=1 Tax=Alicyclobacillus contaminans TaxID=392016 RepID=UPI0003FF7C56|nr:phosphate ABC transporter permease PstA [Alicyclobacillus contaminans]GMA51902.1 phosphate transport system permease protein PstA 2 [Alicyclobacillus contaminans]